MAGGHEEVDLPEGWSVGEKDVLIFEWRCPFGDVCGKGHKLMYKKQERSDADYNGYWHLYGRRKDMFPTWEDAEVAAQQGISEKPQKWTAYFDAEWNARPLPAPQVPKGYGKRSRHYHHRERRALVLSPRRERERSGRRDRSRSRDRLRDVERRALAVRASGHNAARSHEVTISRIELDEMIDGLSRAITATKSCAEWVRRWATQAGQAFDDERAALEACKGGHGAFQARVEMYTSNT